MNAQPVAAVTPRLLNLKQAAAYLGCSYWSVRDYCLAGLIPTINLPALRPREGARAKASLRRVLIDRADLDAFIESRKVVAQSMPVNSVQVSKTAERT